MPWGEGREGGTRWQAIGLLKGGRERERERWPRCTACRDLRWPTAWTRRGYFWRGFKCLDATSNPERKKGESINTFFCVQISITGQTPDYLTHPFSAGKVCHAFTFCNLLPIVVEPWKFPKPHTWVLCLQVSKMGLTCHMMSKITDFLPWSDLGPRPPKFCCSANI